MPQTIANLPLSCGNLKFSVGFKCTVVLYMNVRDFPYYCYYMILFLLKRWQVLCDESYQAGCYPCPTKTYPLHIQGAGGKCHAAVGLGAADTNGHPSWPGEMGSHVRRTKQSGQVQTTIGEPMCIISHMSYFSLATGPMIFNTSLACKHNYSGYTMLWPSGSRQLSYSNSAYT